MFPRRARRRLSASERVMLAVGAGIAIVFITSVFGHPLFAVPVLAIPVAVSIVRRSRRDAVAVLSLYVAFLLFIPAQLIFSPLGGSGTPANVLGIVMLWWWLHTRTVPGLGVSKGRSPVRWAIYGFGAAMMASYAAMGFRPIYPDEISGADRGVMFFLGCAGIALLACDGIADRARFDVLVRRLVAAGGLVAAFGVYQFFTLYDINTISVPLLTRNQKVADVVERSIFHRVAGTASHPIEFGVVMAMLLPLALHLALFSERGKRLRWWLASGVIALVIPMTLSRAAVVTLAVALVIIVPTWPPRWRRRGILIGGTFAVAVRVAIPGLVGTVTSLFTNINNDPSTSGRTQDYTYFADLFVQRPILGRGFFTFLPDIYTIFDNEFLVILVEMGIVGLIALLAVLVSGMGSARAARRAATDDATRHLGQVLAASIAGGTIAFGTFDALSFPTAAGLMFLLIGLAGALRRLTREGPVAPGEPVPRRDALADRSYWWTKRSKALT